MSTTNGTADWQTHHPGAGGRAFDLPPPTRYKPGYPFEPVMDPYRDAALSVTSNTEDAAS
jgi:hypothetical protein